MDEELALVVTGFEVPERQAEAGLMRVFGLDTQHARRFVRALPVVAKRCPNRASADRYAHALRSVGARVELLPVSELDARAADETLARVTSLPIPAPSVMAKLRESMRVERETHRAIQRFRADEGLDARDEAAPLPDIDPMNPAIPKAPPIPRDLHRLPNAVLPPASMPPAASAWSDPLGLGPAPAGADLSTRPPHADAELPPPRTSHAPEDRGDGSSGPPSAGPARGAASLRPPLGPLSAFPAHPLGRPRKRPPAARWFAALLLLAGAYAALRAFGVLATQAERRARAFAEAGIEAGEHAPAADFLLDPEHRLGTLEPSDARELVERLQRAGARSLYAIRIGPIPGGKAAPALLIELPENPEARRVLLWHAAQAERLEPPLIPDRGERYHVIDWR